MTVPMVHFLTGPNFQKENMAEYLMMRGVVKIKSQYVEILRPRFTYKEDSEQEEYLKSWKELDLPEEIKSSLVFEDFLLEQSEYVPGQVLNAFSDAFQDDPDSFWETAAGRDENGCFKPVMTYSEDGVLVFLCGARIEATHEFFCSLMKLLAHRWAIEIDDRQGWRPSGPDDWYEITRYLDPVARKDYLAIRLGPDIDTSRYDQVDNVTDVIRYYLDDKKIADQKAAEIRKKRAEQKKSRIALKQKRKKGRH